MEASTTVEVNGMLESKEPDVPELESKESENITSENEGHATSLLLSTSNDGTGNGDGVPTLSPRSLQLTLIRQISDSLAAPWELTKRMHGLDGEDRVEENNTLDSFFGTQRGAFIRVPPVPRVSS